MTKDPLAGISQEQIINTYDQVLAARAEGLTDVYIGYHTFPGSGGGYCSCGYTVIRPGYDLDPKAKRPWWENTRGKNFHWSDFGGDRAATLQAAKDWASKRYGIAEWKRNRMHDYVDARVAKRFPPRRAE